MAASRETLRLIRETDYLERSQALGQRLRKGLDEAGNRHGFALRQSGPAEMPLIMLEDDPGYSKGYAWNQALLKRGVYFHPWHNMFICAAMTEEDIDQTLQAADDAFKVVREAGPLPPVEKLAILGLLADGH
jgi:glutamate-1-semialdehyde 2,1-aminomutase